MRALRSNKHINLTNHGPNRRLGRRTSHPWFAGHVRDVRQGGGDTGGGLVFDPQVGIYIWTAILVALVVGVVLLVRLVRRRNQNPTLDPTEQSDGPSL